MRGGEPQENQVTRHVMCPHSINPMGPLKVGTRVKQINKINTKSKIKIAIKYEKGCTLAPVLQQDGQATHPVTGKVQETRRSGAKDRLAPLPPPEQIRKR